MFLAGCALLAGAMTAPALELSLEENKGESGTVGYVDIDRVFKEYSGTLDAREEFLSEIKRKEESVNQRKRAVYAIKADIAKLRQERAFALTLPSLLATEEQLNRAEAPPAPAAAPETSTAAQAVQLPPGMPAALPQEAPVSTSAPVAVAASTQAAGTTPVENAVVAVTPQTSPQSASQASTPAPTSLPAAVLPGGINMPGVNRVPVSYFKFSVSTAVPEIDAAIATMETDLKQKEDALKLYQRQMEKELLEYESHRSEILLGRVYIALKELATREGVSVVVDKRNILFGHSAVNLTDKLLLKLEEDR
jgi:Skp family chaperone for outer membrane proteins